ncbi:MAG: hypothetical protein HXX12_06605 [Geothrix sp.]|uniref:hypothetical protein n=1 Tax=Geothrix sp. TaxID=1962974 RepID=UPI00182E8FF1|nr:hypothetical protein [Geothrix sp.]NWJ40626.1 hypothetical protein [Geothrix sp.]WIL21365.1 MAG: hypothetical protein QOZ81_000624 [Geothrix sp.]
MLPSLLIPIAVVSWAQEGWTPPREPDVDRIFNEIRSDFKAGNYEVALQKHLWFHENALKHDRAMYGVRLSYALSEWIELGRAYPRALDALKTIRDRDTSRLLAGTGDHQLFHDVSSINQYLGDSKDTAALFLAIEKQNPKLAKEVYLIAQPALIEGRHYTSCNPYLKPFMDLERATYLLKVNLEMAKDPQFGPRHREFAMSTYTNEVATLVALLIANKRGDEAREIVDRALSHLDTPAFRETLAAAQQGTMPTPRP